MRKSAVGTYTGTYTPKNPSKCINTARHGKLPVYRSSWEARVFKKLDNAVHILEWGSELDENIVKYPHPFKRTMDNRPVESRYHPDLFVVVQGKDGSVTRFVVEIKPLDQSTAPTPPQKQTKASVAKFKRNLASYILNKAKWHYAIAWCKARGYRFLVLTEEQILKM